MIWIIAIVFALIFLTALIYTCVIAGSNADKQSERWCKLHDRGGK